MHRPIDACAALIVVGVLLNACGESQTTTGKRVTLETQATVDKAEFNAGFDTSTGWHVQLSEAALAYDSLYYFDGEPAFVRNWPRPRVKPSLDRVLEFFGEGVAHAHPGHYQAGNALGQMLVPGSIELSTSRKPLTAGDGITGKYRSARFRFASKASGDAAKTLAGHVAVAEGVATQLQASATTNDAGVSQPLTVHFRITADYADLTKNVTLGSVDGCQFKAADVQSDGTVTLTFKPSIWFDLVDFSAVEPGTEQAPTEVASGSLAQLGFALGLVQLTAYQFSFSN